MKKLIYLTLAAVMSLSLIACGGKDSKSSPSKSASADKVTENAQQPAATAAPETTAPEETEAPDPEVLAKLEKLEPFCGGFRYEEYDTTMYGKVNIGGVITVRINEDNSFSAWLPSGLVRIPPEAFDDIISTGSCEFKKSADKYKLTWSEDKNTLSFKHYRGEGEVVPAEGAAERFR